MLLALMCTAAQCFLAMTCLLAMTSPAVVAAEPHDPATLQRLRGLSYAKRDGVELFADIYMPPGEGPNPGVLMVHGGAWAAGSKWNVLFHANQLAQHGYTVAAIDYRLAPKHKFPAQLEDCRAALDWMRANADKYRIDKSRIGAYGYSAGGHLVSLLAVTDRKKRPEGAGRLKAEGREGESKRAEERGRTTDQEADASKAADARSKWKLFPRRLASGSQ